MSDRPIKVGDQVSFDHIAVRIDGPTKREWGRHAQSGTGEVTSIDPGFIELWVERVRDWKRNPIGNILEVRTQQGSFDVFEEDATLV